MKLKDLKKHLITKGWTSPSYTEGLLSWKTQLFAKNTTMSDEQVFGSLFQQGTLNVTTIYIFKLQKNCYQFNQPFIKLTSSKPYCLVGT